MTQALRNHIEHEATAHERLLEELERVEQEFALLTEYLQKEREYLAVFDIEQLLATVEAKHALLRDLTERWVIRKALVTEVMLDQGVSEEELPESMPLLLRTLAKIDGSHSETFSELANRFQIQIDVISELRDVNRNLVQRALWWIDAYLGDLKGQAPHYTATGRRAITSATTLRRTL